MAHRNWNLFVVAAFLLGGAAVVAFNYFVDPYEVFGHTYLRSGYAVNERFRKVDHLLHEPTAHDSFIMGSSVMGVFDPNKASQLSGRRYYNLSFLAGTPKEAFEVLRALKRNGHPVKEVLFGLDFFTFYEHPKGNSPMTRVHPLVSGETFASFYWPYLFSSGLWQGSTRIAHHFQASPSILFDVDGTGMYHLYDYDRRIATDHAQYIREMFPANQWGNADVDWIDERFDELSEFCHWLDDNGIRARFFIHPFYRETLNTVSNKSYAEFKTRLRKIRPGIVDLSRAEALMANPYWYYDKRHYRPPVADKILDLMFSNTPDWRDMEDINNGQWK